MAEETDAERRERQQAEARTVREWFEGRNRRATIPPAPPGETVEQAREREGRALRHLRHPSRPKRG